MTEETRKMPMYEVYVQATRRGRDTDEPVMLYSSFLKDNAESYRRDLATKTDRAFTRAHKTITFQLPAKESFLGGEWVLHLEDYCGFTFFLKRVLVEVPDKKPHWTGSA